MPSAASAASRWRATFLASAGVFLALALLAGFAGVLPGEEAVYGTINGWVSPTGVAFFRVIRYLGRWQFLVPATLLLLWFSPPEARRRWWLWVAVMILAPMAEGLGKDIIARPRPSGQAMGFPSGHVTAAAAYFSLFAYLVGQRFRDRVLLLWVVVWVPVLLVGIARIVQRAHWPADVIGGVALGLAFVSAAAWWHERQSPAGPPA
jgi:membrane-associated phospholipid phosphatase